MINTALAMSFVLALACRSGAVSLMVVDAGSTGTRIYEVQSEFLGTVGGFKSIATLSKTDTSLADSDDKALALLLDDVAARHPRIKNSDIKIIGTGGFRRLDGAQARRCLTLCLEKRDAIRRALASPYPRAELFIVSGEAEGRLSWLSLQVLTGKDTHAIIDIGGSTIELAYKDGPLLVSKMAALGTTALASQVAACAAPADYKNCTQGIESMIAGDSQSREFFAAAPSATEVYGVGGAFASLAKLLKGSDPLQEATIVEQLARENCPKNVAELVADGTPAKHAPQLCAQLSLELMLITKFKITAIKNVSIELGAAFASTAELASP
ncbi:MAG: hypothetical protein AAB036_12075 [Elusimicrobiota bacterium]